MRPVDPNSFSAIPISSEVTPHPPFVSLPNPAPIRFIARDLIRLINPPPLNPLASDLNAISLKLAAWPFCLALNAAASSNLAIAAGVNDFGAAGLTTECMPWNSFQFTCLASSSLFIIAA